MNLVFGMYISTTVLSFLSHPSVMFIYGYPDKQALNGTQHSSLTSYPVCYILLYFHLLHKTQLVYFLHYKVNYNYISFHPQTIHSKENNLCIVYLYPLKILFDMDYVLIHIWRIKCMNLSNQEAV